MKGTPAVGRSSIQHRWRTRETPVHSRHSPIPAWSRNQFCLLASCSQSVFYVVSTLCKDPRKTIRTAFQSHGHSLATASLLAECLVQPLKLVAPDVSQGILHKRSAEKITSVYQLCAKCLLLGSNTKFWDVLFC